MLIADDSLTVDAADRPQFPTFDDLCEALVLWDNLTPEEAAARANALVTGHDARPVVGFALDSYDVR